ncbi:DegT/DnrJ/EryC1/StrS family aminotransferase [Paenibacillus mendelii]|uniref:DegT/DnrJ/EryC1/StrS family aminotransferase n=1 Tax=Paenibacillus mendelii TaxID=206163 RepID=A0ABV6JGW0_9BACL|nr:DegT/DnrJ/EryC1/StrS family aminotransferase [Paenibacillus mendelii]MCQ6557650.1 DegT/DnrJ/EryC1/StrS family aminotransferase [Paenibacillus mendelii]
MEKEKKVIKKMDDPSGRGSLSGYKVPFPARQRPYSEEEIQTVVDVMRNTECQTQGDHMRKFEADLKAYTGANHAFAVDNCTNALGLAATLCRVGPGDEVIIPAYTFCSSAISFARTGAKVVWADINKETWVIDPKDIESKITANTKAIVAVHLLGMPADMEAIMAIARRHNLKVVEDCAQALDARINGRHVGSFGDYACFSFHGAKTMTTLGEGGALLVKSDEDAALVPGLRFCGIRGFEGERERYWVPAMSNVDTDIDGVWPYNYCMGEAQCAVGSVMLDTLTANTDKIIEAGLKIRERMSDTPEISFNVIPEGYRHVMHQFVMHFDGSAFGKNRNDLMDSLTEEFKIRCIVQYYPLYRYPLFQKFGLDEANCPVLDEFWENSFSFPWWCAPDDETIQYVVDSLKAAINKLKNS